VGLRVETELHCDPSAVGHTSLFSSQYHPACGTRGPSGRRGLAFSAFWIVPRLLHLALVHPLDESAASNHRPTPTVSGSSRRIVWILFDELSYDQTFDHRAFGIELPNFDRLRARSVSFSHLRPAGFYTEQIIPSLFSGRRIDQIRSTVDGDLWYKDPSQNRWLAYDPSITLFAVAQQNGWSSGIDGWYNPYCHILASVLNVCSWEPSDVTSFAMEAFGASEKKSILANAATLPTMLLDKLTNRNAGPANAHIQEYSNVVAHAHALIQDDQVNFVFLHIPAPIRRAYMIAGAICCVPGELISIIWCFPTIP